MKRSTPFDWRGAAESLAKRFPASRLDPTVLSWAGASSRRKTWSIAFSGGADSLALLLLVWAHWPERRRSLRALHFDHRLRGRESLADAAFCRKVCAGLRIQFLKGTWAGEHRGASEAEARDARMAFFSRQGGVIWLGHQQDDIAETMLMRIARGSGTGGLAAPRPRQNLPRGRIHLRPLLTLKKSEIVAALGQIGIPWREDSSNDRGDFFRNRIRKDVLPAWTAAAQRDAVAGAARSRLLLEEDDAALEQWVDEIGPIQSGGRLDLAVLAGKPRAFVRRALHRWLSAERRAGEISRQAFDALLEALQCGRSTRQSLGRKGFAVIARGFLFFEPAGNSRRKFHPRRQLTLLPGTSTLRPQSTL